MSFILPTYVPENRNTLRQLEPVAVDDAWDFLESVDCLEIISQVLCLAQIHLYVLDRRPGYFEEDVERTRWLRQQILVIFQHFSLNLSESTPV